MALFMTVSGYLFWNSLNKYSLREGMLAKLRGILIPCAAWGFVTYACDVLLFDYSIISVFEYVNYTFYSNWFLWAVLYCSLYGFITKYVFRNHIIGYVVALVVNMILPDFANYTGTKRMLPFFILGLLMNKYEILKKISNKWKFVLFIVSGILYLWTLNLQMAELVTGTFGSICMILMFNLLTQKFKIV